MGREGTGRGQIGGNLQKQLEWFLKINDMGKEKGQQHLGCSAGTAKSRHRDSLAATVLLNFWDMLVNGQMLTILLVYMKSMK